MLHIHDTKNSFIKLRILRYNDWALTIMAWMHYISECVCEQFNTFGERTLSKLMINEQFTLDINIPISAQYTISLIVKWVVINLSRWLSTYEYYLPKLFLLKRAFSFCIYTCRKSPKKCVNSSIDTLNFFRIFKVCPFLFYLNIY